LIAALALFGSLGLRLLEPAGYKEPSPAAAVVLIGTIIFYTVQMMLHLGFVRTAYLEGDKAQEPMILLKTGSRFFWRLFLFSMAYAGMYLLLGFVIYLIMQQLGFIKAGFLDATSWTRNLCFATSSLILVKLILLPPALIIVRDCGLVAAIRSIGQFKLFSAREPLVWFVSLQVVTYFTAILAPADDTDASGHYFYTIVFSLLSALITLAISLSTVRFIVFNESYNKISISDGQVHNPAGEEKEFES